MEDAPMKSTLQICLLLSVPIAASLALAQGLPKVEVTAEPEGPVVYISCSDPVAPDLSEVSSLLKITDASKAPALRDKLMVAAAEACAAGEGKILVQKTSKGVIWKPTEAASEVAADGNE
jgi:hypothetical protein